MVVYRIKHSISVSVKGDILKKGRLTADGTVSGGDHMTYAL
jgi:hypothetical protein